MTTCMARLLSKRAGHLREKALGAGHPHTKPVKGRFGGVSKPDFPEQFLPPQPRRQAAAPNCLVSV